MSATTPPSSKVTQAMILAAGFGKRLLPLTESTPKPLIKVHGQPLINKPIETLRNHGVGKVVVNTHYLADQIEDHLAPLTTVTGERIRISHEPEILETGGGILKALPHFGDHPFFSINSDIWWDGTRGDFLTLLENAWDDQRMDVLLFLVPHDRALFFEGQGDFFQDKEGRLEFRGDRSQAPYIYTGIQLLHPRLFNYTPTDLRTKPFSLVALYRIAASLGRLHGIPFPGRWSDLGTPTALTGIEGMFSIPTQTAPVA